MAKLPKINILFEDNHLLVVEKPINIPTQKDITNDLDLITILKDYLKEKYQKQGNAYLGLVHRLDRPVGGVMVFAKTSKAASRLTAQVQNHTMQKKYYAVVQNALPSNGTLKDYLTKDEKNNIVHVTNPQIGKEAILNYQVIQTKNSLSLVQIDLITGRSHQIRVQFSSRHNPLYGDHKYSNRNEKTNIALFAYQLTFLHPIKKEKMTFTLDLPSFFPFTLFK